MTAAARTQVLSGDVGDSSWELALRPPPALLRPHVLGLHGYAERAATGQTQRQFPVPYVVVIIEFGPPLRVSLGDDAQRARRHPGGFAAGLTGSFAVTQHDGSQCGVQLDLTPSGARRFFDLPLSELAGRVVALRDLQPLEHATLAEQLDAAPDWETRLDLVEQLVTRRVLGAEIDTARVDWAVRRIHASGGNLSVGTLARDLGYSSKHLISLFRDQVGIPPKLLAQIVRFDRAMRSVRSDETPQWTELAMAHGYFDQAHLAREVRRFTGMTPSEAHLYLSGLPDAYG